MKRLCFLSPDNEHAVAVVASIRQHGIDERHIYAIGNADSRLGELPDGGPDDNDFVPAMERGIAIGGATGLFLGLCALAFPPYGFVVGGGAVLLIGAMSASLGGILTGIAGASYPNSRLKVFEDEIASGKILIMVDVPANQVTRINHLIQSHHPTVDVEGIEPRAPLLPT